MSRTRAVIDRVRPRETYGSVDGRGIEHVDCLPGCACGVGRTAAGTIPRDQCASIGREQVEEMPSDETASAGDEDRAGHRDASVSARHAAECSVEWREVAQAGEREGHEEPFVDRDRK